MNSFSRYLPYFGGLEEAGSMHPGNVLPHLSHMYVMLYKRGQNNQLTNQTKKPQANKIKTKPKPG